MYSLLILYRVAPIIAPIYWSTQPVIFWQVGPLPCRADHPRKKQGRLQHLHPLLSIGYTICFRQAPPLPCRADHPRVKQGCFRQAPPLPCRADHPRVKQGCFRQARPLPPTTGQIIRVGNKLCFKKNVAKSHGFNWFHGLRRPGRQGCFRQARPPPPTTGRIIRR